MLEVWVIGVIVYIIECICVTGVLHFDPYLVQKFALINRRPRLYMFGEKIMLFKFLNCDSFLALWS